MTDILQTTFYMHFLKECLGILIEISLKLLPEDNKPALEQAMACRHIGDKPLPEPMMTQPIMTHICATGLQCVNGAVGKTNGQWE